MVPPLRRLPAASEVPLRAVVHGGRQRLLMDSPAVSDLLLGALGLMLVVEGLMPLLQPRVWRGVFERMLQLSDGQLRFVGLASVLVGWVLLVIWR
ncbi:MAG: hypothetical protein RLY78_3999 [Pseudomonadota bacterium]|jgi:uncharacterized protein YjeT (DUF2065 family)